jgi:hypothetical protein
MEREHGLVKIFEQHEPAKSEVNILARPINEKTSKLPEFQSPIIMCLDLPPQIEVECPLFFHMLVSFRLEFNKKIVTGDALPKASSILLAWSYLQMEKDHLKRRVLEISLPSSNKRKKTSLLNIFLHHKLKIL